MAALIACAALALLGSWAATRGETRPLPVRSTWPTDDVPSEPPGHHPYGRTP